MVANSSIYLYLAVSLQSGSAHSEADNAWPVTRPDEASPPTTLNHELIPTCGGSRLVGSGGDLLFVSRVALCCSFRLVNEIIGKAIQSSRKLAEISPNYELENPSMWAPTDGTKIQIHCPTHDIGDLAEMFWLIEPTEYPQFGTQMTVDTMPLAADPEASQKDA
ncbi:hypothetical protein R3P38DRAFT_2797431 [Favolaschia claudopus]|uniref:Uncharacterized protein n=1 Tax=Favolaschia claudopus TaxID=2862362 RepID=A0AAW0A2J5_9AGAR